MKIIFCSFVLWIILTLSSFAQTADTTRTVDSTYVRNYDQEIKVIGFFSRDYISVTEDIKPNSPINFGIGFAYKNTLFKFSYKFPIVKMDENKYGKTDITDIQIHNFGRHFLIDAFYQRYKGFYSDQNDIKLFPEMSVQKIGFGGTYLFNGEKFSSKAAFEQDERQLQSAGSYALGAGLYFYKVGLQSAEQLTFNNLLLELYAGYSYSWVPNKHWLLAGIATAGITLGNETEKLKNGKIKIFPTVLVRGAVGYHHSFWGIYFSFLLHNNSLQYSNNNKLNLTAIDMQISNIIRLNSFFK